MDMIGLGGVPPRQVLSGAGQTERATTPCARAREQAEAGPAASGDNVEISDAAREALEVKGYADTVRAMPDIRPQAVEEAGWQLDSGALLSDSATRGAAIAMLAAGIV